MKKLNPQKVIVIGDIIIDKFHLGNVSRIAPEAPVPILNVEKILFSIGGAYNLVTQLRSMNIQTYFISSSGPELKLELKHFKEKLNKEDYIISSKKKTSIKNRFISNNKSTYLLRVDYEDSSDITDIENNQIIKILNKILSDNNFIILMDYNKGVVNSKLLKIFYKKIKEYKNIKIFIDTKKSNLSIFEKSYLLKPNNYEFEKITLKNFGEYLPPEKIVSQISKKFNIEHLLITKGDKGALMYSSNSNKIIKSSSVKVRSGEVSGAGDTFLSVIVASLYYKKNIISAVKAANFFAAEFIRLGISYRISKQKLISYFKNL